jgi:hypothetical protein
MIGPMAQRPSAAAAPNPPQDRPLTAEEKRDLKLRMHYQGFAHRKRTRCIVCSKWTNKKSRGYCKACWTRLRPSDLEKEAIAECARKGRSCGTCDAVFGACMHTRAGIQLEMRGECIVHAAPDPKCRDCRSWLRRRSKA